MNVLTSLDRKSDYSKNQLQLILGAWVLSALVDDRRPIAVSDGDVAEEDYDKRSIYSLFYSLYRSMNDAPIPGGGRYELTFNTWGYAWPEAWGPCPVAETDPERFGRHAYTGLYQFDAIRERVRATDGKLHVVELGCGTGAGAHHVCKSVLPKCTYEAVDMQRAAIETCRRKFVPDLQGRLKATWADATTLDVADGVADIVAVNETHVTELPGRVTAEDERFFQTAHRLLGPGGYLVWGNAIPDSTWAPCFAYLESIGMRQLEVRDVTAEAIVARDMDRARVEAYVEHCLQSFHGFRIPGVGRRRRTEAELAMKNFYRNPGTRLYENMKNGTDTYKVTIFQKSTNDEVRRGTAGESPRASGVTC